MSRPVLKYNKNIIRVYGIPQYNIMETILLCYFDYKIQVYLAIVVCYFTHAREEVDDLTPCVFAICDNDSTCCARNTWNRYCTFVCILVSF